MGLLSKNNLNADEMAFDFHFPTSENALIIFTRNLELGNCKTRLAKTIGDESALKIYRYLLQHTAKVSVPIRADKFVFYSEHIKKNDLWNDDVFKKKLQYGDDLGSRMENAFSELFGLGYKNIVIIGSDLLELNSEDISHAFDSLKHHDIVIGPSKDGGYYLLGMKKIHENVFKNKAWGTETVLKDTLRDLQNNDVELLKELNDIDTFEDLKSYKELEQFYR